MSKKTPSRLKSNSELYPFKYNGDTSVIFYSAEFAFSILSLKEHGFSNECICLDEIESEDRYTYGNIMNSENFEPIDSPELDYEDIQMLIHTGGTTGRPKAAMISFRSIFYNSIVDCLYLNIKESDSAILTLPLFHTAGWNVLTIATLAAGGRLILIRNFTPDKVLKIIREERPTIGISVEAMYKDRKSVV